MELKQQALSGIGWSAGARIARQALQFIISVILARLLTPNDFGLVGMIGVFIGFATLFSELGFGAALVWHRNVEERHYSSIFWLNVITGFVLMVIMFLLAPLVASFYAEPRLVHLTMILSTDFLIGSLGILQSARFNREMDFRKLALIETIATLCGGALAIVLAVMDYGVYALVWQSLFFTGVSTFTAWVISDWRPRWVLDLRAIKELLNFSGNLLAFKTVNFWIRNADDMLIGKFVGSSALGIYSKAYTLMLLPLEQISSVVGKVMFPALSKIQDDKQRVKNIYLTSLGLIAIITFPMMLGLLVVSDSFILTLLGDQWAEVIPVLRILCLVGLIQSLGHTTGWIYQSQGHTDWMFKWGFVSGIITIISFSIGIQWGVLGVAWAYAIRTFLLTYFNFRIPGKLIGMTVFDVVKEVAGILSCSAVMSVVILFLGNYLPGDWPDMYHLLVQVPLGIVIYWAFCHYFRLSAYQRLRELMSDQLRYIRRPKVAPSPNLGS